MHRMFAIALLRIACGFAAAASVEAVAQAPAARGDPHPAWRVVIIRGWDALYRANLIRELAMREAMQRNSERLVEFYTEEIDSLRFPEPVSPAFVALLKRKYEDKAIDLVIASGFDPLQFAGAHRDEIWPGAPILFNGVYDGWLDHWKRPARTTGLTLRLDVAGTLEVARKILPGSRKVYFVSGTADFDKQLLDFAKADMQRARLDPPLEASYIAGLSQQEALARVAALGRDSFVVHLTALRDGRGQFSGASVGNIGLVSQRSPVPVFSAIQTQWGRGTAGGSSSRFDVHGQAAGELARSLLEGANPDNIAIRSFPPPTCELDATSLSRWGVGVDKVPLGCEIVNSPPTWRNYFWSFVMLSVVILLEAALLWALWLQNRQRRRAEGQLRERSAELARVGRLSMMGALTASIAHEINQPMGAILSNAEAAEMMLERGELVPEKLREILADIRQEDLRAAEVIASLRKLLSKRDASPVPVDVNSEVAEALRHVSYEAAKRGVTLMPAFDREVSPVLGDAVQLQQVVINLAMNAIEATASGPERGRDVRVSTSAVSDGVAILVADRGPGVAPEDVDRVFDSMFTRKSDGMGFGLSIVKTIVESFGGRVSYQPNVPRGAVFRVWLPVMGA